jgi:proteasome accessory factor C
MSNHNKILRVFQLIGLLRTGPPRTLSSLSSTLGSTDRTVYRYLDLLKDIGLSLRRDRKGYYYLDGGDEKAMPTFSAEEMRYLQELVLTSGKNNKLRDAVMHKLYVHSDMKVQSDLLSRAHLGKIVQDLGRAIQERKQVVLKKYHSANSNAIADRLVEPVKLTPNLQRVLCFEPSTAQNKFFNIERITEVKITPKKFKFEKQHKYSQPDVFGFSDNGKSYEVDLGMTLRACVLLREEYPMASAFIKTSRGVGGYRFQAQVHDLRPVVRFIMGLLPEVEVRGGSELKQSLQNALQEHLKGG